MVYVVEYPPPGETEADTVATSGESANPLALAEFGIDMPGLAAALCAASDLFDIGHLEIYPGAALIGTGGTIVCTVNETGALEPAGGVEELLNSPEFRFINDIRNK